MGCDRDRGRGRGRGRAVLPARRLHSIPGGNNLIKFIISTFNKQITLHYIISLIKGHVLLIKKAIIDHTLNRYVITN